jgi:glycosyltransferase involved in cell wall biosynthesis
MKIAMQSSLRVGGGAGNFFTKLKKEIETKEGIQLVGSLNLFQDIGLYSSVKKGLPWAPYALRIDGIYYDKNHTYGDNTILNKKIFNSIKQSSGVIFQSEFSKKLVEGHYGKIESPSIVVLNGAPLQNIRESKTINIKKKIICSASWRDSKRFDAIVETVKKLRKNIDCELMVLGDVSKIKTPTDSFISYLGIIPPQDVSTYLQKADILIHLCWLDACPNAVVEAISCGLPVVCSNLGGTPEIVEATNGGCIAKCDEEVDYSGLVEMHNPPSPDIDEVVKCVEFALLNSEALASNMNQSKIDITNTAEKYIDFLASVVKL